MKGNFPARHAKC